MILRTQPPQHLQVLPDVRLGRPPVAVIDVQIGQDAQTVGVLDVILAQGLAQDRQGLLAVGLGLLPPVQRPFQPRQFGQPAGQDRLVRAVGRLEDVQRLLVQRLRPLVPFCGMVQSGQRDQVERRVWVVVSA